MKRVLDKFDLEAEREGRSLNFIKSVSTHRGKKKFGHLASPKMTAGKARKFKRTLKSVEKGNAYKF